MGRVTPVALGPISLDDFFAAFKTRATDIFVSKIDPSQLIQHSIPSLFLSFSHQTSEKPPTLPQHRRRSPSPRRFSPCWTAKAADRDCSPTRRSSELAPRGPCQSWRLKDPEDSQESDV